MTYHIEYRVTGQRCTDEMDVECPDIVEAEELAEVMLTRYFGQSWRITGVRTASGLILA